MAKQVSVTREELRVLKRSLTEAAAGSDAEVKGDNAADERASRACKLLADFVEADAERGADVLVALPLGMSNGTSESAASKCSRRMPS